MWQQHCPPPTDTLAMCFNPPTPKCPTLSFHHPPIISRPTGEGLSASRLAAGLWSTVLSLPEGLRPASAQKASSALRLAIDVGLPIVTAVVTPAVGASSVGGAVSGSRGSSVLGGLLDVSPANAARGWSGDGHLVGQARGAGGATKGALLYRRFSDIVHEVLLKAGVAGKSNSKSGRGRSQHIARFLQFSFFCHVWTKQRVSARRLRT